MCSGLLLLLFISEGKNNAGQKEKSERTERYQDAIRPRRDISAPYRAQDKPNPNHGDWHNEVARDLPTAAAINALLDMCKTNDPPLEGDKTYTKRMVKVDKMETRWRGLMPAGQLNAQRQNSSGPQNLRNKNTNTHTHTHEPHTLSYTRKAGRSKSA